MSGEEGTQADPFDELSDLPELNDGESVGIEQRSVLHGQIRNLEASHVLVEAYGSGAPPEIDAADVAPNGDFRPESGNVFRIQWEHAIENPNDRHVRVWVDGNEIPRVDSLSACDGTPGSTYCPDEGALDSTNPITVYVHPPGSTDPTSDAKTYEITKRDGAVLTGGQGVTIRGLHGRRPAGSKSFGVWRDGRIERCVAGEGQSHNFFLGSGVQRDCVALKGEPRPPGDDTRGGTHYVSFQHDPRGETARYVRCIAVGRGHDVATHTGGFSIAHGGDYQFDRIDFDQCVGVNLSGSGMGGAAKKGSFQQCTIFDSAGQLVSSNHFRPTELKRCLVRNAGVIRVNRSNEVLIENLVVYGGTGREITYLINSSLADSAKVTLRNCHLHLENSHQSIVAGSSNQLVIENSIIASTRKTGNPLTVRLIDEATFGGG